MRSAKELLVASKDFATENRWLSWWHVWSTLGLIVGLIAVTISDAPLAIRVVASVVAGLGCVRMFIIYHDFQHGAILRDSRLGGALMGLYGMFVLNPPSVWVESHDYHHRNNSQSFGTNVGSFPIMTTDAYASATTSARLAYAVSRHPLTIVFGYLTVFLWRMSLQPFLMNPRRHWDGGLAVLLHCGVLYYMATQGVETLVLGMILPLFVASALGAYFFYAQHNYPAAKLKDQADWSHVDAALHASSFMVMGPIMNWFTGNIGYHHVHHLNARIPFYRLPEAMAALEELQSPGRTSLNPRDIVACLRLKLWSPEEDRFVGFQKSRPAAQRCA